ncbi:MAG: LegC family aminotransferase [Cycloclasticus sp.]|nr:LegC family aminotransferase [Cycloclasticus sp.]
MYSQFVEFVRDTYQTKDFIPLHAPIFAGNEKRYVLDAIESTYVSSVGNYVDELERMFAEFVGAKYAIATVNGTSALHIALLLSGVEVNNEVITQPLTFVATCNAINYCGAQPVFIDVDRNTMGLSPVKLQAWLEEFSEIKGGQCVNKVSGRVIRACVPMHTFGHPAEIDGLKAVCERFCIALVEDAAESLGSLFRGQHTGTFGALAAFSFNGNKIITSGGGGMIVTNDEALARRAKHITTTAKVQHKWEYMHDQIGFNYRMPNLNAALGCAQLEQLPVFLERKRELAEKYKEFFSKSDISFVLEGEGCKANYWLNTLILPDRATRDKFLELTNENGVMTRPAWVLMSRLHMFADCLAGDLSDALWLEERLVNIPSSVVI